MEVLEVLVKAIKISTIEAIESIVAGRKGDDGAASSDGGGGKHTLRGSAGASLAQVRPSLADAPCTAPPDCRARVSRCTWV